VVQRIKASVVRLTRFPSSGRTGQVTGTMELVITRLPYIVVYRLSNETVEILRMFHTSQETPEQMR
jgi:toxin ParE1/3/4